MSKPDGKEVKKYDSEIISEKLDTALILAAHICLISIILFSASFVTYLYSNTETPVTQYVFAPVTFFLIVSLLSALWIRVKKPARIFTHMQLCLDALIVTGVIYVSGGTASPLLFLYVPLVMAVSIVVSRAAALAITVFASFCYTCLILAIKYNFIPNADGTFNINNPQDNLLLQLIGLSSGMILVAILTSFLMRAMRRGQEAAAKSLKDIEELSSSQKDLEHKLKVQDQMARLLAGKDDDNSGKKPLLEEFVGESTVMKKVFNLIEKVANTDATILISGESGSGKELAAKAIHLGRKKPHTPFIAVNCGAIPENLIESQLFGHKKGSFTSADSDMKGLFEQANHGSIFLDEIGELPLLMQAKLLRVIQEKSIRPLGSEKDIPIDVRIIAATNKNLKREVEQGKFREDLFYRLNVININLPPLRSRREDIPLLVNSILSKYVPVDKKAFIPPGTMHLLMNYSYPGNVRELQNILERAVILGGEVILPEHLPSHMREKNVLDGIISGLANDSSGETQILIDENLSLPVNLEEILNNIEKKYLEVALLKTKGAKKKAAQMLGINVRSFRYRLQKFGMSEESSDSE